MNPFLSTHSHGHCQGWEAAGGTALCVPLLAKWWEQPQIRSGFHHGQAQVYQPKPNLPASGHCRAQAVRVRTERKEILLCLPAAASSDSFCHLPTLPFPSHTSPSCSTCRSPRTALLPQRKQCHQQQTQGSVHCCSNPALHSQCLENSSRLPLW